MSKTTLKAAAPFPIITTHKVDGSEYNLTQLSGDATWKMIVVYRGKHCPICTSYLNELEGVKDKLKSLGVDLVAVSGDSKEQVDEHLESLDVSYDLCYGLTIEQMNTLGLYISNPRSPEETDHPFAEPGLFIINEEGNIQIIDLSNAPFARPDLNSVVSGIEFVRENDYPIRGTF